MSQKDSLPHNDYIHRLIEDFRESSPPERMRRVLFSPEKILCEYASASCHLPGAYVEFFPCPHCTYTDDNGPFVEVFHFSNVHEPKVCATATFVMPADFEQLFPHQPTGCSLGVELTNGCPNAPLAVDHSPRVATQVHTDTFIEVLRFLPRSDLETTMLVSRRWSSVIGRAKCSLQQRRSFNVMIKFCGGSSGMLSVHFLRRERLGQWRILRVLTTRGLWQAFYAVRSHLQNALVEVVLPFFVNSVPPPSPPLVDMPLPRRINWLNSLLRPRPLNAEFRSWIVSSGAAGFGNLPTLAGCALHPHRKLGYVQKLGLDLYDDDATWAQLAGLLNQPSVRGFNEISIVTTKDFVALRDVSTFVAEFSLRLAESDGAMISEMPDVNEATGRRKRFRYHLEGKDTVVRVHVYANRAARECLTVVTFDHFRRTVHFFKGKVSLPDLKLTLRRTYAYD